MTTAKKKMAVPASESGYWKVELGRVWLHEGFLFKPSADAIQVDRATLDAMIDDDAVTSVTAI